jgi:hypothetical protein
MHPHVDRAERLPRLGHTRQAVRDQVHPNGVLALEGCIQQAEKELAPWEEQGTSKSRCS